ncbi:MAG: hypothetical protein EHM54_06390 [Nitrospiraceae bacterium]|nr:MAG: hypothetical protein EHM54_06390 [Nitrospiraceae bacterium]
MLKKDLVSLLKQQRYAEIAQAAGENARGIFRLLISVAYDKSDIVCWRAIEATGIVAGGIAKAAPEVIRNLAQRLLWMMRDESGNNPWSAPEMLGEIVRNSPDAFADIAPVIASFHDELMLRGGVLRAIFRIGEVRPDLIDISGEFITPYLRDEDPVVRAYSLLIAGAYKLGGTLPVISALKGDGDTVTLYIDGDFSSMNVGRIAGEVFEGLSGKEC